MDSLAEQFNEDLTVLFQHKTDGGAVYLVDNHKFADAKVIIRLDGGADMLKCNVKEK